MRDAIPLTQRGHRVFAGDIARNALARAQREARIRDVVLCVLAADMMDLPIQSGSADVVMACDNSLPHLPNEEAILAALGEFHRCVRPGGGCVVTMRNYGVCPPTGTEERRSYGTRLIEGRPHEVRQTWIWDGPRYNLTLEILDEATGQLVLETEATYFAIPPARVTELMVQVGFTDVRREDEGYYQPILVGTRPPGRLEGQRDA